MSETGTVLIKEFGLQKEFQKWFELVPTTSIRRRSPKASYGGMDSDVAPTGAKSSCLDFMPLEPDYLDFEFNSNVIGEIRNKSSERRCW